MASISFSACSISALTDCCFFFIPSNSVLISYNEEIKNKLEIMLFLFTIIGTKNLGTIDLTLIWVFIASFEPKESKIFPFKLALEIMLSLFTSSSLISLRKCFFSAELLLSHSNDSILWYEEWICSKKTPKRGEKKSKAYKTKMANSLLVHEFGVQSYTIVKLFQRKT